MRRAVLPTGDAGTEQVGELDLAAADPPLVHPPVLPLGDQHRPAVEDPLAGRAHLGGQDGPAGVPRAERVRVELRGHGAGAEDLCGRVAAGVAYELGETHLCWCVSVCFFFDVLL